MGRITVSDMVVKIEGVDGGPADHRRRSLIKAGLAASILALRQAEPSWALENRMSNNKKHSSLPGILSMSDVNAVSPALAHYTEARFSTDYGSALSFRRVIAAWSLWPR